ncbi:MAG TPA: tetratricopeptide repeat protein [Chthoniobacteraceae bacterium]|nr:tetratricopeptide repeat protein [Chthoniobacteraceae bacterium]
MYGLFSLLNGFGGVAGGAVALAGIAFSLWMAYDCWKRNGEPFWIYLILFSGGMFAIIYFFTQYWPSSRMEYGLWNRLTGGGRLRELEGRAKQLNTAACYETLGHEQYDFGRYEKAEAAFREALAREPESGPAQAGLGYTLMKLKRAEEAWPFLAKAYRQQPDYDHYQLLWRVARCQAQRGNYAEARGLYEFFLQKHGYSEARIEYAQMLVDMGEPAEGKAALEELIAEIDFSPRYARHRERTWRRAAQKLLRAWNQTAAQRRAGDTGDCES